MKGVIKTRCDEILKLTGNFFFFIPLNIVEASQ